MSGRGGPEGISWHLIEGINPEPWQSSQFAGRGKGKRPDVYKPEKLRIYQEALAEEFRLLYPEVQPFVGEACSVTFCFWRTIESYELESGRKASNVMADATNLQKATEDALQGILYENDRVVQHAESYIIEQSPDTEPAILVEFLPYRRSARMYEMARAELARTTTRSPLDNLRPDADVPF